MTLCLPHRHTGNCPMQAVTPAALLWTCGCRQSMQHGLCSFAHPFQNYTFRLLSSEAFSPRSPHTQQEGVGREGCQPAGQVRYNILGGAPRGVPKAQNQHGHQSHRLGCWGSEPAHRQCSLAPRDTSHRSPFSPPN